MPLHCARASLPHECRLHCARAFAKQKPPPQSGAQQPASVGCAAWKASRHALLSPPYLGKHVGALSGHCSLRPTPVHCTHPISGPCAHYCYCTRTIRRATKPVLVLSNACTERVSRACTARVAQLHRWRSAAGWTWPGVCICMLCGHACAHACLCVCTCVCMCVHARTHGAACALVMNANPQLQSKKHCRCCTRNQPQLPFLRALRPAQRLLLAGLQELALGLALRPGLQELALGPLAALVDAPMRVRSTSSLPHPSRCSWMAQARTHDDRNACARACPAACPALCCATDHTYGPAHMLTLLHALRSAAPQITDDSELMLALLHGLWGQNPSAFPAEVRCHRGIWEHMRTRAC